MEQWLLGACALHKGVEIKYLFGDTNRINTAEPNSMRRIGFTHLAGDAKHSEYWINKIADYNKSLGLNSFGIFSNKTSPDQERINLQSIPYKVLISLKKQKQRRANAQRQLAEAGLTVNWKVPVKIEAIKWDSTNYRYRSKPAYASQAMTLLKIFDEVEEKEAETFVLFEDDVVLHPEFETLIKGLQVPTDWQFIYLGGRNCGQSEYISKGIVRSDFVADLHAVIIRSEILDDLRKVLTDPCINSAWPDFRIATLQKKHPTYLCRPNLAWQSVHSGVDGGLEYSNYTEDGSVKPGRGN
jgi:hypothetical protein